MSISFWHRSASTAAICNALVSSAGGRFTGTGDTKSIQCEHGDLGTTLILNETAIATEMAYRFGGGCYGIAYGLELTAGSVLELELSSGIGRMDGPVATVDGNGDPSDLSATATKCYEVLVVQQRCDDGADFNNNSSALDINIYREGNGWRIIHHECGHLRRRVHYRRAGLEVDR